MSVAMAPTFALTVSSWLSKLLALLDAPLLAQLDPKLLARYAGPILVAGALLLLLVGVLFGRRWLRGLGVAIWLTLITLVVVFAIFVLADAARIKLWGLPVLLAGLLAFLAAGEWALRRLRAN